MLDITAANTARLPTHAAPARPKGFKKMADAKAAAVLAIGPHARPGFEFEVAKVDGQWIWREFTEPKPLNAAQIKAEGGKKAPGARRKAASAPEPAPAIPEPPSLEAQLLASADAMEDNLQLVERVAAVLATPELPPVDDDIPVFLKREAPSEAEREALVAKHKRTTGPGRKLKNPPNIKIMNEKAEALAAGKGWTKLGRNSSYDWQAAEKLSKAGKVPALPPFSSYAPHLKKVHDLATMKDAAGIREFTKTFKDREGGRVNLFRFVDLCLAALGK